MDWILRQARLADDKPLQDVAIQQGRIAAIAPNLTVTAANEWDLAGRVLLVGGVDLHTHLDKTYATTTVNKSGTLLEAISVWRATRQQRTPQEVEQVARRALHNAISYGVTAIRSHLDIGVERDLQNVEVMLGLREAFRGAIDLQFVALSYIGLDAAQDAVIEQALMMGVDFVGGAPSLVDDPQANVDATIALAQKVGKPIDLHMDETEDPTMLTLEYLADKTIEYGLQGQVTAGHCCSLAFVDQATADRIIDKVAAAQINIVSLPSCNLVLMGRQQSPVPRGVTRIKAFLARGVTTCAASDNVRDPFNPFGAYDMLQTAHLAAHAAHLTGESELYDSLALVTAQPARAFGNGLPTTIEVGAQADLVIVDAARVVDTVLYPPPRLGTFKAGKLVVKTEIKQEWLI